MCSCGRSSGTTTCGTAVLPGALYPCHVIAAICIFLSARRLTQSSSASFIGTLVFILNPNVLYLQSIPLSETVCIATSAMTAYYFLCWVQDGKLQQMILVAICVFFATLSRYDG